MNDDKRLSFFFLGLGIGVAAGILFAPKAGEETRRLIRDKTGEGADFLRRRTGEFREQATDMAESVLERGRETLTRQRDSFSAALDAGREAYREATNARTSSDL
jgi:gas vesicle protein